MSYVRNVRCYRTLDNFGKERVILQWDLVVPGVIGIIGFNVYRADLDKFENIAKNITQNFYLDEDAELFPDKVYYYKVTYNTLDGESSLDDAITFNIYTDIPPGLEERLYWTLIESVRRVNMGLNMYGELCKVYVKKAVGVKCPECYDEYSRRAVDPTCAVCYGTGISGGYDTYLRRLVVFDATTRLEASIFGLRLDYRPKMVISNYPYVSDGDLFKRQDGRIFMISNVSKYLIQNYLIEQVCDMSLLDYGHPSYGIP